MADLAKLLDFDYSFEEVNESTAPILAEVSLAGSSTIVLSSAWSGDTAKAVIVGARTPTGKFMQLYIEAGGWSDSTNATITTRVLAQDSSDITDADTANDFDLPAGSKIFPVVSSYYLRYIAQAILGSIGTGGLSLVIGDETDSTVTIKHIQSGSTVGWLRNNITTSKVQFSNNGTDWVNLDNAGVGTITWGDGLNGGLAGAAPYVEIDNDVSFLTGGTSAQSTAGTWAAVTDGSFRIGIDGTNYNVDGIDFSGDASMANVASTIQVALRVATGGSETVAWSTDHFIITSVLFTASSAVTVTETSSGTVGTDISGAGASDWMDSDTGNGTVTAMVESAGLTMSNNKLKLLPGTEDNKTLVAGENLTAEDLAYVENDGKAWKTVRSASGFSALAGISTIGSTINTLKLDNDVVVTLYNPSSSVKAVVSNISHDTATSGTVATVVASNVRGIRATVIGTNKFAAVYEDTSDNKLYGVICTVSGTTITSGTPVKLYDAETVNSRTFDICKLDTDKFLVTFVNLSSDDPLAVACTVSGTVITAGSSTQIEASTSVGATMCEQMTTDEAIVFYNDGTNISCKFLSVSGTTVSLSSAATDLYAGTFNLETSNSGIIILDTENILLYAYESGSGLRISRLINLDTTNYGTAPQYNSTSDTYLFGASKPSFLINVGNNIIGHLYEDASGDPNFNQYELSNNSFKEIYRSGAISSINITNSSAGVAYNTNKNSVLLVCPDSDNTNISYSVFRDTSNQFIGIVKETVSAAETATLDTRGDVAQTGLTVGQAYYVGDAGAVATSGERKIGVATTTTNLYLN